MLKSDRWYPIGPKVVSTMKWECINYKENDQARCILDNDDRQLWDIRIEYISTATPLYTFPSSDK